MNIKLARKLLGATQEDISDDDLTKLINFMEQMSVLLLVGLKVPKERKV